MFDFMKDTVKLIVDGVKTDKAYRMQIVISHLSLLVAIIALTMQILK